MSEKQLFSGKRIELTAVDPENDSKVESLWTFDLEYTRHFSNRPPRPMAAFELRKALEESQKESEDKKRNFIFAIRTKKDKKGLIGIFRVPYIEWNNQVADIYMHFADPTTEKLYFKESIGLALYFLFEEMNMHHVAVMTIAADRTKTIENYEREGFEKEVVLKDSLFRDGKYIDEIILGILRQDWEGRLK